MVTKCVVPNCGNSCNAKLSVTLFSFPKDSKLAQRWIHATRAQYLREIKSHHKVCSDHFEKHFIRHHFGATRLTPGAIPTKFEWNKVRNVCQGSTTASVLAVKNDNSNGDSASNGIILPKPELKWSVVPKVRIPPLVRRIPLPQRASLNFMKNEPLMCDVILPNIQKSSSQKSSDNLSYKSPLSISSESDVNLDDDGVVDEPEYIHGDESTYPPLSVKDEFDEDDGSLSEEIDIVKSLQNNEEEMLAVETLKNEPEEVVVEQCSIIEEVIIPPEEASSPLTLAVVRQETNLSTSKSISVGEESSSSGPGEMSSEKRLVPKIEASFSLNKRSSVSKKSGSFTKDGGVKLRKLQPRLQTTKTQDDIQNKRVPDSILASRLSIPKTAVTTVVPPMALKVGNVMVPVTSSVVNKPAQVTGLDSATKSVKLSTPHMTYLIPFSGAVPPPLAIKASKTANSDTESSSSGPGETKSKKHLVPKIETQLSSKKRSTVPKKIESFTKDGCVKLRKLQPRPQTTETQDDIQNTCVPDSILASRLSFPKTAVTTVVPPMTLGVGNVMLPVTSSVKKPAQVTGQDSAAKSVVPSMALKVGNMTLPVTSSVVKQAQVTGQGSATNFVKLATPHMTYLIPISGVVPPPLAIKASANSGNSQNVTVCPEATSNEPPSLHTLLQKQRSPRSEGNGEPSSRNKYANRVTRSIKQASVGKSRQERRLWKMKGMIHALRKKDQMVKKLTRDKMCLTKKLKTLRKAYMDLRRTLTSNLPPPDYLEVG